MHPQGIEKVMLHAGGVFPERDTVKMKPSFIVGDGTVRGAAFQNDKCTRERHILKTIPCESLHGNTHGGLRGQSRWIAAACRERSNNDPQCEETMFHATRLCF